MSLANEEPILLIGLYIIDFSSIKDTLGNCVEAFAATLYIVGSQDIGKELLRKFKYNLNFFKLNHDYSKAYAVCQDSARVVRSQTNMIENMKKNEAETNWDLFDVDAQDYCNLNHSNLETESDEGTDEENLKKMKVFQVMVKVKMKILQKVVILKKF